MARKSKKTHDTTIFTLSHSSLETMVKCQYAWYLKYIQNNYPEKNNEVTDFGNLCHEIAEKYGGGGPSEIKRLFNEIEHKYILSPEYALKLPKALERIEVFYNAMLANATKVHHEKEFRLAHNVYIDITGKVDVLYKTAEGEWIVVDYKTSKKFGNYLDQFAFYYYLITKTQGKCPPSIRFQSVYFCAGEGNEIKDFVKETVLEVSDMEITEQRIETGVNTILTNNVDDITKWKKKPCILCDWCEYGPVRGIGICEGRTKKENV